jgi:undecaprenyl-diphosphatase
MGTGIYKILKTKTIRPRPYQVHQVIHLGERPLDHFSFPSGHTLHAVMATILLGYIVPPLLVLMVPFTVLVAGSRMVLGLHYPSDVMVGGCIGAAVAGLIIVGAPWWGVVL